MVSRKGITSSIKRFFTISALAGSLFFQGCEDYKKDEQKPNETYQGSFFVEVYKHDLGHGYLSDDVWEYTKKKLRSEEEKYEQYKKEAIELFEDKSRVMHTLNTLEKIVKDGNAQTIAAYESTQDSSRFYVADKSGLKVVKLRNMAIYDIAVSPDGKKVIFRYGSNKPIIYRGPVLIISTTMGERVVYGNYKSYDDRNQLKSYDVATRQFYQVEPDDIQINGKPIRPNEMRKLDWRSKNRLSVEKAVGGINKMFNPDNRLDGASPGYYLNTIVTPSHWNFFFIYDFDISDTMQ
jgi:hypothetical protein